MDVETAHLANPVIAIGRLLASEAGAYSNVSGDESRIVVSVALGDSDEATISSAERWILWVIHNAGVRGHIVSVRLENEHTASAESAGWRLADGPTSG